MNPFITASKKLTGLQSQLQKNANRIWWIQSSILQAYRRGHRENDFLPRRLHSIKNEEQVQFKKLIQQLHHLVTTYFDQDFIAFSSVQDVKTVMNIRKTIRYIKNAYTADPPVLNTLTKLNTFLQGASHS